MQSLQNSTDTFCGVMSKPKEALQNPYKSPFKTRLEPLQRPISAASEGLLRWG